jgi:hypothetical protein
MVPKNDWKGVSSISYQMGLFESLLEASQRILEFSNLGSGLPRGKN